jgi:hypothetical protein
VSCQPESPPAIAVEKAGNDLNELGVGVGETKSRPLGLVASRYDQGVAPYWS